MMRFIYFILLLLIQITVLSQQRGVAVKLSGSVWNDSSAQKIPVEIFKKVNGRTYKINKDRSNGDFTVDISRDTEAIIFSLGKEGETFLVPVTFYGEFKKPISAVFSLNVSPDNKRQSFDIAALFLGKPTTPATKYVVQHFRDNDLHCEIDEPVRSMNGNSIIDQVKNMPPDNNSHYILKLSDSNQKIIGKVSYQRNNGMVFIDTNIYETDSKTEQGSVIIDKDIFRIIAFEQSGYIINDSELPKLDSIVDFCSVHPDKLVEILGFTDGVGEPKKNETLAMYRAKVVRNYLLTSGVNENRIKHDWEKAEAITTRMNDLEEFRKVEIRVR